MKNSAGLILNILGISENLNGSLVMFKSERLKKNWHLLNSIQRTFLLMFSSFNTFDLNLWNSNSSSSVGTSENTVFLVPIVVNFLSELLFEFFYFLAWTLLVSGLGWTLLIDWFKPIELSFKESVIDNDFSVRTFSM